MSKTSTLPSILYWFVHGLPCQQSLGNKGRSHKIQYKLPYSQHVFKLFT